eukprot:Hpha_TRINITY_DN15934_c1_g11::TRINITY_DN15934_c1_g11_i1::g.73668::m.73668
MSGIIMFARVTGSDKVLPIELPLDATVGQLKQEIEDLGGPSTTLGQLCHEGHTLDNDNATLADLGVCPQTVVQVIAPSLSERPLAADRRFVLAIHGGQLMHEGIIKIFGYPFRLPPKWPRPAVAVAAGGTGKYLVLYGDGHVYISADGIGVMSE